MEALKGLCKEHGLSTNGVKALLCSRLLQKTDAPALVDALDRLRGTELLGGGIYPACPFGLVEGELTVLVPPPAPGGAVGGAGVGLRGGGAGGADSARGGVGMGGTAAARAANAARLRGMAVVEVMDVPAVGRAHVSGQCEAGPSGGASALGTRARPGGVSPAGGGASKRARTSGGLGLGGALLGNGHGGSPPDGSGDGDGGTLAAAPANAGGYWPAAADDGGGRASLGGGAAPSSTAAAAAAAAAAAVVADGGGAVDSSPADTLPAGSGGPAAAVASLATLTRTGRELGLLPPAARRTRVLRRLHKLLTLDLAAQLGVEAGSDGEAGAESDGW
ncbi:hypothetical protein MMPV_008287 [Pyropia vietnamensis]